MRFVDRNTIRDLIMAGGIANLKTALRHVNGWSLGPDNIAPYSLGPATFDADIPIADPTSDLCVFNWRVPMHVPNGQADTVVQDEILFPDIPGLTRLRIGRFSATALGPASGALSNLTGGPTVHLWKISVAGAVSTVSIVQPLALGVEEGVDLAAIHILSPGEAMRLTADTTVNPAAVFDLVCVKVRLFGTLLE